MIRTLKTIVLPALIGLALLALIGLVGSGIIVYREATNIHPVLGWLVIAIMAAAAGLLIVYPLIRVVRLPRALSRPKETTGPVWEKFVRRYAKRLAGNERLKADYPGLAQLQTARDAEDLPALEREVESAIGHLDAKAKAAIGRHAAAVFTATAVSQSGRLDSVIVLSAQFRMVKEVAEIYYQRPGPRELVQLYANVGAAAFVAGEIQDSEILAVLGAPVTAGITGFIPVAGADPLVNLLVSSLLDGSANAFLTLRIGTVARRYCALRLEDDRRLLARSASLEAAGLLGTVVGQGASRLATLTRKLVLGGAARSTSRAAKGVAGVGANLFGKIFGLAEKAGAAAVESTGAGVRFLNESLRFWETVAEKTEAPAEQITPPAEAPPVAN